jgi:hypothetical protein
MSTLVRKSGLYQTNNRWNTRASFTAQDGSAIVVVSDPNSASAASGYGDATGVEKLYIFTSADRSTWTLRTTIVNPVPGGRVTANLAPSGLLGIVCSSSVAMRYIPVSTATWLAGQPILFHNFEGTTHGWSGSGWNVSVANSVLGTDPVSSGQQSLKATVLANGASAAPYGPIGTSAAATTAGTTVTATADIRATVAGRTAYVALYFYNAAGTQISTVNNSANAVAVSTTAFTTLVPFSFVAPATTAFVTMQVVMLGSVTTGEVFYVDEAWIQPTRTDAAATETVRADLTGTLTEPDIDISFTSGSVPVIGAARANTTGSTRLQLYSYVRRTSDNTWVSTGVTGYTPETTITPKQAFQALSIAMLTGGSSAVRSMIWAIGSGNATNNDRGIKIVSSTINESTGAITNTTLRKTYGVGDVPSGSTATAGRLAMLYQSDDNEYVLAAMGYQNKIIAMARGTYDGTTFTETVPYVSKTVNPSTIQYGMAATYSAGRINFVFATSEGHLAAFIGKLYGDNSTSFGGRHWFDNQSKIASISPMSNGGPYPDYPTHDLVFTYKISNTKQEFSHIWAYPTRAPVNVQPAAGATVTSDTPPLRADADLDVQYPQSNVKMAWEFATDTAFTTNQFIYEQDDDQLKVVNNTNLANTVVSFVDELPDDHALSAQGVWYVRAYHVDEFGVYGTPSAYNSFTVSHPPAAAQLSPAGGGPKVYGATMRLTWVFTDPSETDFQTAYQAVVERVDTGAGVYDSGKITSTNQYVDAVIPTSVKEVGLRWKVTVWDSDDVSGPASGYAFFVPIDAPSVTLSSPIAGTITTAIPTITGTVTVGGGRAVVKYKVKILKTSDSSTAYDSGWLNTNLATGGVINFQPPPEILQNTTGYTIQMFVVDNLGLTSAVASVAVTTGWTPPATATTAATSITPYNTEGQGWNAVTWADTARDPDFVRWVVFRRDAMIDAVGTILDQGPWNEIGEVTAINTGGYTFKDYYAPSGYRVDYRVEQEVNRFGDVLQSTNGTVMTVFPLADSYWVIDPEVGNAFQLGKVIDDQYTVEYEEADYYIIGRGNHYEQGDRMGYRGTLGAQLRNQTGASARQRKLRLEQVKEGKRTLYLRNPFGDIFRVAVGAMQISRVAGVGVQEFVDLTIPYLEVGE